MDSEGLFVANQIRQTNPIIGGQNLQNTLGKSNELREHALKLTFRRYVG